jgi:hypothetical protein
MSRLTPQPREKVIRAITKAYGCERMREGARHEVYGRADLLEVLAIPRHREISPGVIRNVCKILGVSVDDFLQKLRHC